MRWLISDFALLSVVVRALILSTEAMVLGGVVFRLLLPPPQQCPEAFASWRRVLRASALALFAAQLISVAVSTVVLLGSSGLSLRDVAGASFVAAGFGGAACALLAWWLLPRRGTPGWASAAIAFLVLGSVLATSHAAAQLDRAFAAMLLTALHHAGTAMWIGAMPYFYLALPRMGGLTASRTLAARYSNLALAGVALLLAGGIGMALLYVGSWAALYGTAYGVMLMAKVFLCAVMVALGASNFYVVRELRARPRPLLTRLRRFVELEIGLGFTVLLAAASLTSQPPARDLVQDRLSLPELAAREHPLPPRLSSPPLETLSPKTPLETALRNEADNTIAQSQPSDIAWSEYNHHWAGLIVLAAGTLALLSRTGWRGTRWARHWPLAFAALAAFVFLRADPENWPLGPGSFWASFYNAEILQHRIFVLFILGFAWFEWRVQLGRAPRNWWPLVFPAICAAGAALLLTHNHALGNVKEELLAEYSHTPIALTGALAGWGRWLEVRLPADSERNRRTIRYASLLWPVCLMVAGLVLLNYREA